MGDFCLSRGPFTVPLMQILCNTFIFKSQAGTLCSLNWVGKVDNKFKRAYCHNIYILFFIPKESSQSSWILATQIVMTSSFSTTLAHSTNAIWHFGYQITWILVNCFVFLALVFNALLEFNTIQNNICLILFWKYVLLMSSKSVLVLRFWLMNHVIYLKLRQK